MDGIVSMLQMMLVLLVIIIFGLGFLYLYLMYKSNNPESTTKQTSNDNPENKNDYLGKFEGVLTKESIKDFMEFDEIVDNMIVRKNGTQYVMVIQCNGVNYDLLSEQEKIAVEEGFVQFLNVLRFPVQLYVQTRSLNLRDIIEEYRQRVDVLVDETNKLKDKMKQAEASGNKAMVEKLFFEIKRKQNVLEYGINITEYVEKMSLNKNVLQQKTYVILSYYTSELGIKLEDRSKEDINGMCFSELYTRSQNIISALAPSDITGRILDSEELAELLYVAYNRDESELLQLSKALDAQYDSLYSSGKDVLEKRKKKLDEEISMEALDVVTDSILEAGRRQELSRATKNKQIKKKALELLNEYKDQMDGELYTLSVDEVKKATENEEVTEN